MCKVNWNIEELRKLYIAKVVQKNELLLEEFLSSTRQKMERANYHAQKAKEAWEEFFKPSVVTIPSSQFDFATNVSVAETEALVYVLNSMADLLAQVVNITLLELVNQSMPEDEVFVYKVLNKLSKFIQYKNVTRALSLFLNSSEFKYINAFCNTMKHRKLLDTDYHLHINYREKGKIQEGLRFKEFSYKEAPFPITWSVAIQEDYRLKIYDYICDVGININKAMA